MVDFYNLDAIIAVGYRVNSKKATRFRQWATKTLKEYITKGFVLNDELMKNGRPFGRDYFDELLERIREIRANIPEDMPMFMRIDAHDDYLEGGLNIEEIIDFCKLAGEAGVDVLDISRGNILSAGLKYEVPPVDIPKAFNIDNAARIRKETEMLTIGVGRINTAELAEQILEFAMSFSEENRDDMTVLTARVWKRNMPEG